MTAFDAVLPSDLAGKSVLDVGLGDLAVTREAERRGAQAISAFDFDAGGVAAARAALAGQGSRIGIERRDLEREGAGGRFDVVLCLCGLARFRNPLGALERLAEAVCERLVVAIPAAPRPWRVSLDSAVLAAPLIDRLAALYLSPSRRKNGSQQAFIATEKSIVAVLKGLRQDFARLDIHRDRLGHRTLLVAHKRHIGRLHLLAGVNAVGKSTMLDQVRAGKRPELAKALGLDPAESWVFTTYAHLMCDTEVFYPRLVVQYNITAPLVHGPLYRNENGLLDLVHSAETTEVTTLWLPPEEAAQRYREDRVPEGALGSLALHARRRQARWQAVHGDGSARPAPDTAKKGNLLLSLYTRKKADQLLGLYGDPAAFDAMYRDWFEFARRHGAVNRVVFQDPDYRVGSIEEWLKLPDRERV
jgi:hypothetical protein